MGAHSKGGNDRTAQDFRVQRIIMHERYKRPFGLSNDIALLKLNKPAQLNRYVGLACLPGSGTPQLPIDDMSKKCWITGDSLIVPCIAWQFDRQLHIVGKNGTDQVY